MDDETMLILTAVALGGIALAGGVTSLGSGLENIGTGAQNVENSLALDVSIPSRLLTDVESFFKQLFNTNNW